MTQVKDKFPESTNVSNNQLMIVVQKNNPFKIKDLLDLAKPGLRIGIGHEQNCALGAITAETFRFAGVYGKVHKNVKVTSPTGDALVNQLRAKSLDVVIAYHSNVKEFLNELDAIELKDIKCATASQPIAVSKNSTHPDISRRLTEYLMTPESRERFESLGFGWELKEVESKKK
jgi:ABC-type molybdate transport system substrate-binding protein